LLARQRESTGLESQPEHFISLPLVSKKEDSADLPLVMNVVIKYWGEDFSPPTSGAAGDRGATMIHGIELGEALGFSSYIYKSSIKDLKKRIDQGIPPIVIMPGIQATVQHATVVSGYNSEERRIPSDMKELLKNENLMFPKSNRICFEAEGLRQHGKVNEAIESLQKAIEIDSDNPQAWNLLGGIYNETNSDQAVPCYQNAIKLNSKYYLAYRGLGNYYLKMKDYSLAEAYYSNAININPSRFTPIYKNRAIARMQLGNNQGAKEDLVKYLEQMPAADDRKTIQEALDQF